MKHIMSTNLLAIAQREESLGHAELAKIIEVATHELEWLTSRLKDAGEVHHYESGEIERLRAALKEAVPYIEGAQNTTSVETFRAAASLLAKIQELLGERTLDAT
jgi:hypothetical protein